MLAHLTYIAMGITCLITGYMAVLFLRDSNVAMTTSTHRLELLPRVMTGRYIVLFLIAIGVLILNDVGVAAYFFAVCTFLGLYDGWLYWRNGYAHIKHTITGLLAFAALCVSLLTLTLSGEAV